jgi:hypothetical protein
MSSFALSKEVMVNGPDDVFVKREGRIERVRDRLFEGEEPVMHLMGDQIREAKRRITPHEHVCAAPSDPVSIPNERVGLSKTLPFR